MYDKINYKLKKKEKKNKTNKQTNKQNSGWDFYGEMGYLQNLTVSPPKRSSINNVVLIYVENLTNSQQLLYPPRR